MDLIWGHFIIFVLTGVLLLARKRHPKVTGRTARLAYPWTIKIAGILGFLAISAFVYMCASSPEDRWKPLSIAGPLWLLMLGAILHAWCTEIVFDEECIYASSITGSRMMLWSDVIKIKRTLSKYILHDVRGQKIVLHEYLGGVPGFIAYASQHVEANAHRLTEG